MPQLGEQRSVGRLSRLQTRLKNVSWLSMLATASFITYFNTCKGHVIGAIDTISMLPSPLHRLVPTRCVCKLLLLITHITDVVTVKARLWPVAVPRHHLTACVILTRYLTKLALLLHHHLLEMIPPFQDQALPALAPVYDDQTCTVFIAKSRQVECLFLPFSFILLLTVLV